MCEIQEILKIVSPFIMDIQNASLKIFWSSYEQLKCLPDIYNMPTQKQASFTVTPPRHVEAQDKRGDM